MLFFLKIGPQVLHVLVVLKFGITLYVNNSHLNVMPYQFIEHQCECTLALILWLHCRKQEVESFGLLYEKRLEYVPPSKWEQVTFCLTQRLGKRENAYTKRHKIVVLVNHQTQQALVGHRQVHLHKLVNLLWSERRKAIQLRVALVAQFKESPAITLCYLGA